MRLFAFAVPCAVMLWTGAGAASAQETLRARIKIDSERKIGEIDRKIYGNFAEHLGRCIYGGIFDEGSALADKNGYRRDVKEAVDRLKVPILRWPGGNFSSGYHWLDGIGPRDSRPERLELAWRTTETNRFGTHEFLDYTEMMGIDPYICLNLGTGTWDEAKYWVEYTNVAGGTYYSDLRKKNGRDKPWNVKYWSLGNEMDGPWQMGHRDAVDYSKFALEAAKLMRWTDPGIKLVAAGSSNFNPGADWVGWNRTVLNTLRNQIDYISVHTYVGNTANDYYDFIASAKEVQDRTKILEGTIREALVTAPRDKHIYIAWDEWNVWYRARGGAAAEGHNALEEKYNLEDSLVVATFLNTFVNNAHIVKMANMAQLVNVIAPIFTNKEGLFLQTIYFPLALFANNSRGTALDLFIESPTYTSHKYGDVPYLDVSAAYDNGTVVLNVVNRSLDKPVEVHIDSQKGSFHGSYEVAEVNGPDIKAENTFGSVKVHTVNKSITADGPEMIYSFPPHSYTMIKGALSN